MASVRASRAVGSASPKDGRDVAEPVASATVSAGHAVVIGFGLPGRAAADAVRRRGMLVCVIELNPLTVRRCERSGVAMIHGDAHETDVLRRAGVGDASMVIIAVPEDKSALSIARAVRRANPSVRLVMRCEYVSTGLAARKAGADEIVVAEQAVAEGLAAAAERGVADPVPHEPPQGI